MKKKFLTALLCVTAALCLCFGLAACGETPKDPADSSQTQTGGGNNTQPNGEEHTHTYSDLWTADENKHWHAATCGHASERSGEAAHTYQNGKCKVCDYTHEEHAFVYSNKTEEGHTGTCSVCEKVVTEEHDYQNGVCADCDYTHEEHTVVYSNKTEEGHTGTCSVCEKVVTEEHDYQNGKCTECHYMHQNHSYGADNLCEVCGAKKPYTKSADGTKIYFGEYPQTEMKESGLKGMLGMEAGKNPTSSNAGKWTDYGYYIAGRVQSYMWYIDVEYQGNRYRGVYFTSYRPNFAPSGSSTDGSSQNDNGYETNTVYWFKYEPIEWRILEEKDGTALLMANIILDSQQYYRTTAGTRTVDGKTVYPSNYKESDIRAWLNETFYETAFDGLAQEIVETTTVDNSASTTELSSNPYVCENTEDKVFLLSYKDVLNTSYGFDPNASTYDTARQLKSTDYAKSQGIFWDTHTSSSYFGNGWWWLRSPDYKYSYSANFVVFDGHANNNLSYVFVTFCGVVPALRIKL